jgi:hypothetical protein
MPENPPIEKKKGPLINFPKKEEMNVKDTYPKTISYDFNNEIKKQKFK